MGTPKKEEAKEEEFNLKIEEMNSQGLHLGHRISKLHPRMARFIIGIRNTVHIFDLKKTKSALKEALKFIADLFEKGGEMLLVGTKPPLRNLVEKTARDCGIPFVTERWLGGTFTNFKVISKRARYFQQLENQKAQGEFEKFSKKEKIRKERELAEMRKKFEGIKNLEKIPEAVFICDLQKDKLCLKEAKEKGVKVIAICDTNVDPSLVDYPIPANDDSLNSVKYILEKVAQIIKELKAKSLTNKKGQK